MYYTYVLENENGGLYIGQTSNLDARLGRHNSGRSTYTRNRGEWRLLFKKEFEIRSDAVRFEKYLKSLKNQRYIREHFHEL